MVLADFVFNQTPDEFGTAQTTGAYQFMQIRNYVKGLFPTYTGYASQGVIVNLTSICNAYYEGEATRSTSTTRAGIV